jgi:hypothetical protein
MVPNVKNVPLELITIVNLIDAFKLMIIAKHGTKQTVNVLLVMIAMEQHLKMVKLSMENVHFIINKT